MLSVKYFFKHSRVYCLERCRFISQLEILWICHLEEGNLYMWVAGSILCLLGLQCNCFINWNTLLVSLKLWGTRQEHVFVFSWKLVISEKPLREENVTIHVQEQLLEPVCPHSWVSREGCKVICKVDLYQLCFCEFPLMGLLDMLVQTSMRNTKVMWVNAEHGDTGRVGHQGTPSHLRGKFQCSW